jgi:hypothetical protein
MIYQVFQNEEEMNTDIDNVAYLVFVTHPPLPPSVEYHQPTLSQYFQLLSLNGLASRNTRSDNAQHQLLNVGRTRPSVVPDLRAFSTTRFSFLGLIWNILVNAAMEPLGSWSTTLRF